MNIRHYITVGSCVLFSAWNFASATPLFVETFDDNSKGWTEDSVWSIASGVYTAVGGFINESSVPFGLVSASDMATGQYTVSYDFMFLGPGTGYRAGAMWLDNSGGENRFSSRPAPDKLDFQFFSIPPGSETADGGISTSASYLNDQWYHADLTIDANQLKLFWDGALVAQGSVTLYDMDLLGFGTRDANAAFDNLVVQEGLVPEPSAVLLACWGGLLMIALRRRSA